jgi:hypothetical protein
MPDDLLPGLAKRVFQLHGTRDNRSIVSPKDVTEADLKRLFPEAKLKYTFAM